LKPGEPPLANPGGLQHGVLPESNAVDTHDPALLKAHWRAIFKEELEAWCTDNGSWSKSRTEALFRAWFKLELCTIVFDVGKAALKLEA